MKFVTWVAIFSGISERVADIKTRAHAMKCLTAFCEAVGPGFVFDRVRAYVVIFFCLF
jgi:cytoskeleton-associated protein 5